MNSSGYNQDYAFIADLYDHVVPYANRPDVDFYVRAAEELGGPVLEVGCGTGRVLIPTAQSGLDIVGLDSSTSMLDVCRQSVSNEPEEVQARIQLQEADMRDFNLGQLFKLITIPFRPFQHLITVTDQLMCLGNIYQHLMDDGRLIFDVFNPSFETIVNDAYGEEIHDEPEFTAPDGRRVIRRHKIVSRDRANQVTDVELIYYVTHPDGREERLVQAFPMRYLFRFEVEHLLGRCGFEVEHLYGDFDKSPFGSKYPGELIFVAKKVGH